ncbi:hypothetical protein RSOL_487050 [Rhizoctonia solani AG-3 Rhs1AP]|uniref:Uncharacterized protein n=3 Tax=Rhizoctonia solani AG-3 TaxID=1086053 RepID=A0A074S1Z2_9AGAM|nr:hypothetical protein RSOL_487050 [Rhizoctonia solani AG-3 Rhs1AP]KEP50913.1 hypothetical protein V565_071330 [Rhizoctonia solani 123E]
MSTTTTSTTATTATSTATTYTVPMKVFNSVELVLMLMSMFTCVTKDIRTTVMFLLEIVFGYEPLTRRFVRKPKVHEVRTLFEPLSALALSHCTEYTLDNIQTKADALAMVSAILQPILIRLTPAEFAEIHNKADDAVEIMIYTPLSEIQDMVAQWASDARMDSKFYNWLEWSRCYAPAGQTDIKPVDVSKAGAIIAQYLHGDSVAISTSCSLRRTDRVEKHQREDPPLDSFLPTQRPAKNPLPARPCPVHVIVTSPTVADILRSSTSLASLAMDVQAFIPSHRGVQHSPGEWVERGALDTFKFPVHSDIVGEPAGSLDSSDNWLTTDDSAITSYTGHTDEETLTIPTSIPIPISRTLPGISNLASPDKPQSYLQCSRSAPQLTNAPWTRSPSELAAHGTLGTLCSFSSLSSSRIVSPNWRAFSISSSLSKATDSDVSDWSLRMQWLEHEDDSFILSRGGSVANLCDISYESFRFPRVAYPNGLDSLSTASDSTATTPTSSTPATSVENLVEDWVPDWQSGQLDTWKCAIREHDRSEYQQEALAAEYAEWADEWQTWELDAWSNALTGCEVELCLDTKARRVEVRQAADSGVVRFARRIGGVFGL